MQRTPARRLAVVSREAQACSKSKMVRILELSLKKEKFEKFDEWAEWLTPFRLVLFLYRMGRALSSH